MRTVLRSAPVVLCLLALSGWVAAATLYKWVDADGVVHYSDTPHAGAEKIQVSGAQTYHNTPVPEAAPAPSGGPATRTGSNAGYVSCAITRPGNDDNLFAPDAVQVSVSPSPGLQVGDSISVAMDGQPLPPVGDGTRFVVESPERGAHTITAQIRGPDGSVLCNAAPVSFSVQRPSVNSPQSPVKPH
ncbi:MAG: DUF4124 domain-containing protein [Steroidobacteraceae bacterium]